MIRSMTGFGRGKAGSETKKINIEMRAVNHRFCEITVRMPRLIVQLEDNIKRKVRTRIARGKVDVYVEIEDLSSKDYSVKVDKNLAMTYYRAIKELQEVTGTGGETKIEHLVSLPGIIEIQENQCNAEDFWPLIDKAVDDALQQLIIMRETEGVELAKDLRERSEKILSYTDYIHERSPLVVEEYRKKLLLRLEEWFNDNNIDSERVAVEVALFADRCDITEELVRLRSHLSQVKKCLEGSSPVGRKLDFLIQEMHREINTIGSKANDVEIANAVVELKSELEKIREQVQNIE